MIKMKQDKTEKKWILIGRNTQTSAQMLWNGKKGKDAKFAENGSSGFNRISNPEKIAQCKKYLEGHILHAKKRKTAPKTVKRPKAGKTKHQRPR